MAVIFARQALDQPEANRDGASRGGQASSNYEVLWNVQTDSVSDDQAVVLDYFRYTGGMPYYGDSYQFGNGSDANSIVTSITAVNDPKARKVWRVTVRYTPRPATSWPLGQPPPGDNNPFGADEYEVDSTQITVPAESVEYMGGMIGQSHGVKAANPIGPATNSAFEVFDDPPLEMELDIKIVRIARSYLGWSWLAADGFRGAVNASEFDPSNGTYNYHDNWFERLARLKGIRGGSVIAPSGEIYWRISWEFWILPVYEIGNPLRALTWRDLIPDRGMHQRAWSNDPKPGGGVYLDADFPPGVPHIAPIQDPFGVVVTQPVLLDGNGQPAGAGAAPVYLEYRKYKELDYGPLFQILRQGI